MNQQWRVIHHRREIATCPHLYTKLLTKPTLHSGSSSQPFKCCSIWNPCLSPVWLQPAFGCAPDKAVNRLLGSRRHSDKYKIGNTSGRQMYRHLSLRHAL